MAGQPSGVHVSQGVLQAFDSRSSPAELRMLSQAEEQLPGWPRHQGAVAPGAWLTRKVTVPLEHVPASAPPAPAPPAPPSKLEAAPHAVTQAADSTKGRSRFMEVSLAPTPTPASSEPRCERRGMRIVPVSL